MILDCLDPWNSPPPAPLIVCSDSDLILACRLPRPKPGNTCMILVLCDILDAVDRPLPTVDTDLNKTLQMDPTTSDSSLHNLT